MKHEVWRDYAGVWHMNEDSGTAYDSTSHGLDALPDGGANADLSCMTGIVVGACGKSRLNDSRQIQCGNHLKIPSYDAFQLGGQFSFMGWFKGKGYMQKAVVSRICSRKRAYDDVGGWGLTMSEDTWGIVR